MRFRMLAAAAMIVAVAAPGAAQDRGDQTERVSRTFRIGDNGRLLLSNIAGEIVVSGGGGEEVVIEAVKRSRGGAADLAEVQIEFSEGPGRLEVRTRHQNNTRRSNRTAVDYTVTVPRNATVDLNSISGDVRVTNVRGPVRAQTVSGSVVGSDLPRVEAAKSISGTVELTSTSTDGSLQASTVSGTVRLRDVKARSLELGSVSGDVETTNVEAERLEVKSVSGNITFVGAPARNGVYEFNSHSGDVRVSLSGGQGFEYSASTFSGAIRSDMPSRVENQRGPRRGRSQSLRGEVGDGGATLRITTFSGDIVLARR